MRYTKFFLKKINLYFIVIRKNAVITILLSSVYFEFGNLSVKSVANGWMITRSVTQCTQGNQPELQKLITGI